MEKDGEEAGYGEVLHPVQACRRFGAGCDCGDAEEGDGGKVFENVRGIDGGVSGDTSEAGKARLGWTLDGLERKPDLVILELGANDMLRGLDPALTEANLAAMLQELDRRDIPVLLAGMRAAPNLDPAYIARFDAIYPKLAKAEGAHIYPFFLDGVAAQQGLVQADGMHPTFEGVKRIVKGIMPAVKQALADR